MQKNLLNTVIELGISLSLGRSLVLKLSKTPKLVNETRVKGLTFTLSHLKEVRLICSEGSNGVSRALLHPEKES